MPTPERLAEQFEEHRSHVRAVAYRMLGSVSETEDAVQEAWIRLSRTDVSGVVNLRGWLTTVVALISSRIILFKTDPDQLTYVGIPDKCPEKMRTLPSFSNRAAFRSFQPR